MNGLQVCKIHVEVYKKIVSKLYVTVIIALQNQRTVYGEVAGGF